VVAAVAVVGGLAWTGTYPFERPGSGSPGPSPTFDGAVTEAQPSANAIPGGPWQSAFAAAIRITSPVQISTANLTQQVASLGCNVTDLGVLPKYVTVDATSPSSGPGTASFWVIGFTNVSGGEVGVMVDGGVPTALFTVSPTACSSVTSDLLPFPSGSPDSPAIVGTVNSNGGSAFLTTHPNSSVLMLGVGGVAFLVTEPSWVVAYSSCPVALVTNTSGFEFNATVEGTTLASRSSGPVTCAALPTVPALGKAI
jgi:hypothetical protein